MNKSIFTYDFPEISTNKELQKIIQEFPEYDPYYIASSCKKERKELFDGLWQIYQPLADKHFLSDCKKHFHQRVWEMYLGVSLIKNGLDISSSKREKTRGRFICHILINDEDRINRCPYF